MSLVSSSVYTILFSFMLCQFFYIFRSISFPYVSPLIGYYPYHLNYPYITLSCVEYICRTRRELPVLFFILSSNFFAIFPISFQWASIPFCLYDNVYFSLLYAIVGLTLWLILISITFLLLSVTQECVFHQVKQIFSPPHSSIYLHKNFSIPSLLFFLPIQVFKLIYPFDDLSKTLFFQCLPTY